MVSLDQLSKWLLPRPFGRGPDGVSVPRGNPEGPIRLSEALVSVLNLPVNPGVTEVGDLRHEEEVITTKGGRLTPFPLLHDLATAIELVVFLPEPVESDVINRVAIVSAIGPDVPADPADANDLDRSVFGLLRVRLVCLVIGTRLRRGLGHERRLRLGTQGLSLLRWRLCDFGVFG